jgi:hypothetical protein
MNDVQVIGDTIEYKGIRIAKLVRLPHVSNTMQAEFIDYLHNEDPTVEDERNEAAASAVNDLKSNFKIKLEACNSDPLTINEVMEIFDEVAAEA